MDFLLKFEPSQLKEVSAWYLLQQAFSQNSTQSSHEVRMPVEYQYMKMLEDIQGNPGAVPELRNQPDPKYLALFADVPPDPLESLFLSQLHDRTETINYSELAPTEMDEPLEPITSDLFDQRSQPNELLLGQIGIGPRWLEQQNFPQMLQILNQFSISKLFTQNNFPKNEWFQRENPPESTENHIHSPSLPTASEESSLLSHNNIDVSDILPLPSQQNVPNFLNNENENVALENVEHLPILPKINQNGLNDSQENIILNQFEKLLEQQIDQQLLGNQNLVDTLNQHHDPVLTLPTPENQAPQWVLPLADQTVVEDAYFNFQVSNQTFTDDSQTPLTYIASLADGSDLPAWLHFDPELRTFSGLPQNQDVGELHVQLTALDAQGASVSATFNLLVQNSNDAPEATQSSLSFSNAEDAPFHQVLPDDLFIDIDGDRLNVEARLADGRALPDWLHFDTGARSFSGTPGNAEVGHLDVLVSARDPGGLTASVAIDIAVANTNDAPVVARAPAAITTDEDQAFYYQIPADVFNDVDVGDQLIYSADLLQEQSWPAWLNFDAQTGTFSGTPSNAEVGNLQIKLTATDAAGASVSTVLNLTVLNTNDAPTVVGHLEPVAIAQDSSWIYQVPAELFADVDRGDVLSYQAVLADGQALPAWLHFDANTRTFSGQPGNQDVGQLAIKIIASDGQWASASEVFHLNVINVNDAPIATQPSLAFSIAEDAPLNQVLPDDLFIDIDGDRLNMEARLADGRALPDWLHFDSATRSFSGTPGNAEVGHLDVLITAQDSGGLTASVAIDVEVTNTNDAPELVGQVNDLTATETVGFSATLPANLFRDIDLNDQLTYSLNQADGSALPAWLHYDPATRILSGIPANGDAGTLALKITATDRSYAQTSDRFNLLITPNTAPTAVSDSGSANLNSKITGNVLMNDSDAEHNGLTAVLVNSTQFGSLTINNQTGAYVYTPYTNFNGTDSFTYQAFDGNSYSAITTVTLTINPGAGLFNDQGNTVNFASGSISALQANLYQALGGDDIITLPSVARAATLGYDSRVVFQAGDGNDSITASTATVIVDGGAGNDRMILSTGNVTFDGGAGTDRIDVRGTSSAEAFGFSQINGINTWLYGSQKVVYLNTEQVYVYMGSGNDTLNASTGIRAGSASSVETIEIYSEANDDTLVFAGLGLVYGAGSTLKIDLGSGNNSISFSEGIAAQAGGVLNVLGNTGADQFNFGRIATSDIASGQTRISINASSGNDSVQTNEILMDGGNGLIEYQAGSGNNSLMVTGQISVTSDLGYSNEFKMVATTGVDTISIGQINISGYASKVTVETQDGNDSVTISQGIHLSSSYGNSAQLTLSLGNHNDSFNTTTISAAEANASVLIDFGSGNNTSVVSSDMIATNGAYIGFKSGSGADNFTFNGNLMTQGRGTKIEVLTGSGNDVITLNGALIAENAGDIVINAGDGNDQITAFANSRNAQIFGGTGNDTFNGGSGNNYFNGEAGNDTFYGSAGTDYLTGGANNDAFRFTTVYSNSTTYVTDFATHTSGSSNKDLLYFALGSKIAIEQTGTDLTLHYSLNGNSMDIVLQGVNAANFNSSDYVFV